MNESLLILADFLPVDLKNVQTIGLQEIVIQKLFELSRESTKPITFLYIHPKVDDVFKSIFNEIRVIKAAGGIVKNGHGQYLFIHRLGKWDLPKGKVEEDEKIKTAARREVEEECGLIIPYVGAKTHTTYHLYTIREKVVLKKTSWYEMGVNKTPDLTPQLEEQIDKAEWIGLHDLNKVKENTYPLILDIVNALQ